MTDKEMILTVSRIAQEFCNVLPQEAVCFLLKDYVAGITAFQMRPNAIWTRWPTLCSRSISIRRGTADLRFASSEAARPNQSGSTERQRRRAKKENGRPLQGRAR